MYWSTASFRHLDSERERMGGVRGCGGYARALAVNGPE